MVVEVDDDLLRAVQLAYDPGNVGCVVFLGPGEFFFP